MENSTKIESLIIASKALISAIPYIGGSISSVMDDLIAKRKEERFQELITSLDSEIRHIQTLNQNFISHEDFLDLFENISKHVVNERDANKRIMYKNLILCCAKDLSADFDRTEKYIRMLDELTTNDSIILRIFFNPINFNNEVGCPIVNRNMGHSFFTYTDHSSVLELLKKLLPEIDTDDIIDSLDFLERNRLVITHNGADTIETNGNPIHLLENKITSKGKDFIRYITNENY